MSLGNGSSILEDGDVTLVKLLQAFSTYYTELFMQIPSQMRLCLFGNALIQGCIQVELMNISVYYSGGIKGTLLVQSVTMVTFASRQWAQSTTEADGNIIRSAGIYIGQKQI